MCRCSRGVNYDRLTNYANENEDEESNRCLDEEEVICLLNSLMGYGVSKRGFEDSDFDLFEGTSA